MDPPSRIFMPRRSGLATEEVHSGTTASSVRAAAGARSSRAWGALGFCGGSRSRALLDRRNDRRVVLAAAAVVLGVQQPAASRLIESQVQPGALRSLGHQVHVLA